MTLIMSMSFKDQFAFITCDSRVVKQEFSVGFEPLSRIERTDLPSDKVNKLTDYVLLSTGGISLLGEIVKKEMKKRVKPYFDLAECSKVLREIIDDLRERRKKVGLWKWFNKKDLVLDFLDVDAHFGCCMAGFYKTGGTGMTLFGSGKGTVPDEVSSPIKNNEGYPVFMFAPTYEYEDLKNSLFHLPLEKQNINEFLNAALIAHGTISFVQQDAVSPDCNVFALARDPQGGPPKFINQTIDTSIFYGQLATQNV